MEFGIRKFLYRIQPGPEKSFSVGRKTAPRTLRLGKLLSRPALIFSHPFHSHPLPLSRKRERGVQRQGVCGFAPEFVRDWPLCFADAGWLSDSPLSLAREGQGVRVKRMGEDEGRA